MFISIAQIKAARALLGWNQTDLANHCGVNDDQIRNYESGRSKSRVVLEAITKSLTAQGIEFIDGGVIPRSVSSYILDSYMDLLDDIAQSMPDGGEVLKHCVDDRRSTPEVIERVSEMRRTGIRERLTIADDNSFVTGDPKDYRQIPTDYVASAEIVVTYDNKVAFFADGKAVVIVSNGLSQIMRHQFEYWWEKGKRVEDA